MRRWFASALIAALSLFGAGCDDLYEDDTNGAGEAEQQDDDGGY
jgi:hypothetical protein